MSRYDELCEVLKECDKEKKTIEQYLQMQMKDYEIAYLGDRKITWKKQSRSSIDTKKLREDYPEIVEKYVKTTNTRVFKVSQVVIVALGSYGLARDLVLILSHDTLSCLSVTESFT